MHGRPLRRSAPPGSPPAFIRRRSEQVSESPGGTTKPANVATEEAALKVPILEAEIKGLRQRLAEVQANREALRREMDDLRRDCDHWRNLAKSAEAERARTRTWFCGRATRGD
jgi:septal ring factor EnvC (AmiA/AmiB activator)